MSHLNRKMSHLNRKTSDRKVSRPQDVIPQIANPQKVQPQPADREMSYYQAFLCFEKLARSRDIQINFEFRALCKPASSTKQAFFQQELDGTKPFYPSIL